MEERFKVLGTQGKESIPWLVIAPHEARAVKNHCQTLEHINKRGGLSWSEILAVLEDRACTSMDEKEAKEKVRKIVDETICTVRMVDDGDGHYVPFECCSFTNPATSGGESFIDDISLPCAEQGCVEDCDKCIIQKIMDEYAELTSQKN